MLKKINKNLVDSHISFIYENICIEEMWRLNGTNFFDFVFDKVGRWWNNDTEIDIVAFESSSVGP